MATKPPKVPTPKPTEVETKPEPPEPPKEEPKAKGTASSDPVLQALVKRPLGVDGRNIALELGLGYSEAYTRLNQLCEEGLARRANELYQPTPDGAMRAAGQA